VTDDEPAQGRGDDEVGGPLQYMAKLCGELHPGRLGTLRVGQVQGTLKVVGRVQAGREEEVAPLVGTRGGQILEGEGEAHDSSRSMPYACIFL